MDSEGHRRSWEGGGGLAMGVVVRGRATFCSTFTPPEVVTKVAKRQSGKVASFFINTQAVDLPILPTMTSGGERRDARGEPNLILLPHHFS